MNTPDRHERDSLEARKTLDRLKGEGDVFARSAIARAAQRFADHLSAKDAGIENEDRIELWGRRIGRTLSVVGFVVLAAYLIATYVIRWPL